MAAPLLAELGPLPRGPVTDACASVMFCTVKSTSPCVTKMRVEPPPLSTTDSPPSMTVFAEIVFGDVSTMVVGAFWVPPHLNVTMPPIASALANAVSVHDAALPSPTTVVGAETSTGIAGGMQELGTGGGAMPVLELMFAPELAPPPPLLLEPLQPVTATNVPRSKIWIRTNGSYSVSSRV